MKQVNAKTKWIFAIGQLGWSILAGIISNLLVNFYLPDATGNGIITFVTSATFIGLTVIGLITAAGRSVDAVTPIFPTTAVTPSANAFPLCDMRRCRSPLSRF